MPLDTYRSKRDFSATPEPVGDSTSLEQRRFVIHEHAARRLHFDLRLEIGGVLKSWAVPKGPTLHPREKRLAVMTEDHPLEYLTFHGEIPEGSYGAGSVAVWDTGTFDPIDTDDPEGSIRNGKLTFVLHGSRLCGGFHLTRTKQSDDSWLLFKADDECADASWELESALPPADERRKHLTHSAAVVGPGGDQQQPVEVRIGTPAPMPASVSPMLATASASAFDDPDWLFEAKLDGYRGMCYVDGSDIRIVSRGKLDFGKTFPELLKAIRDGANAQNAIIDGEIVAVDADGVPRFQLLQNASGFQGAQPGGARGTLVYYAFDLLYCNGRNLMAEPLVDRKRVLRQVLREHPRVRFSDHVRGSGKELFEQARKAGLEGVVAKLAGSRYEERRSRNWLKIKAANTLDVVIGGYTEGRGTRQFLGALVVGLYRQDGLHCVGHAGTGFTDADLTRIHELLQPLATDTSPFAVAPQTNEKAHWVRPELVCEVRYGEWTGDDRLRHPVFLGLRPDKDPRECTFDSEAQVTTVGGERNAGSGPVITPHSRRPVPAEELFARPVLSGNVVAAVDDAEVPLTNLEKVYWQESGLTKGDMVRYYYQVAGAMLPHLADRPLVLKRYPDGASGQFFYQHNVDSPPPFVQSWTSGANDEGERVSYVLCNNLPTLLYLANLGAIELNPWHSIHQRCEYPDWIVFDLDPGEQTERGRVCGLALAIKDVLAEAGLQSFPKTSGGDGLHIYVPLIDTRARAEPVYTHEQATAFAEVVANLVVSHGPRGVTLERMTRNRKPEEIYLDYLQNGESKTLVAPYSLRARPGAPASAPLAWEEVARCPSARDYSLVSLPERAATMGDLFEEVLRLRQGLGPALDSLARL